MRKILFAALAAMVMFASCDKESDNNGMESSPATLSISIVSSNTKALGTEDVGDLAPNNDKAVSNFYVFVLDGVGNVITKQAVPTTTIELTTTTAAKEVYVVANEETAYDVILEAITTKSGLEALEVDIATASGGKQIDKRWITGSTSTITWEQPDEGAATVNMTYIASRITVKVVDQMNPAYNHTASDGSLVLGSIAVLNANGTSKLFGASLVPATLSYYTGMDFPSTWVNEPASWTNYDKLTDPFTGNDFYSASDKNVFYYYVFSRNAVTTTADFPTIVTLCGTYENNPIYFPVHLASYDKLIGGLERGNSYDITITLKGDPTTGGGGTTDPTEPVISATLDVTLNVTDWIPVDIDKEFQ